MSDLENHAHTSTPENDDYAQYKAVDVGSLDATTRDDALAYIHDLRIHGQLTPEQFTELDSKFRSSGAMLPSEREQARQDAFARQMQAAEDARVNQHAQFTAMLPRLLSDAGVLMNPLPTASEPAHTNTPPSESSLSDLFAHYGITY